MTDLNSTNLQEIITSTLSEFFAKNSSLVNSPNILLWTNTNPKYPNSFILKIDQQKLLGLERKDKRGETYWKFKLRKESEAKESDNGQSEENNPVSSPVMDNVAKYQERLNKTQALNNHDQSKSVNS